MTQPSNRSRPDAVTQAELTRARYQLPTVFSVGAPVTAPAFLAGRSDQIDLALATVSAPGQHAIIYGERGVGKTSVASLIHLIWTEYIKDFGAVAAARIQCDHTDDYGAIWRKVAEALQRDFERKGIKPLGNGKFEDCAALIEAGAADPTTVCSLFDLAGMKAIVVIDEFDAVEDENTTALMSATIKQLSDFVIDATLILVGVADSVDDLIAEHRSIDRCLRQVFMPRMSIEELREIVESRLKRLGMTIYPRAVLRIAALSQGFPYYAHLLGLHSAMHAIEARQSLTVEPADVDSAITRAISESQQSVLAEYTKAVSSPRPENLYRQTLLACALSAADDLGYFAPADLKAPISTILKKSRDVPTYIKQLDAFTKADRGPALEFSGDARNRRFRFVSPLLKPYVVLRGISDGLITELAALQFTQPEIAEQLALDI
ncbi:MAG: orc1/cdc6 family replication initiation protein [Dehalococcoidia bacterium]|nr:orc1/cdc6 family replication initiation protein [Dehalococcoidia bacterium]